MTSRKYFPSHFDQNQSLKRQLHGKTVSVYHSNGEIIHGRFQTVRGDSLVILPYNNEDQKMRIALLDIKHIKITEKTHLGIPILVASVVLFLAVYGAGALDAFGTLK